jgi:hypothetical protein
MVTQTEGVRSQGVVAQIVLSGHQTVLDINLGEGQDKRFELSEPPGRVFKAPETSLRLIQNVLD